MYDCPSLVGPELINRTQIEFYCDIKTNETDSAATFNVSFLFDYQQDDDVPLQVVTADNPRATLHERYLANRLNRRVSVINVANISVTFNNNDIDGIVRCVVQLITNSNFFGTSMDSG